MIIKSKNVFHETDGFIEKEIYISGKYITEESSGETIDFKDLYVIPALTDVHFHGCVGMDLTDASLNSLSKIAKHQLSQGIGQICPAGMTLDQKQLEDIAQVVCEYSKGSYEGAKLVGIHLEGPFLSMEKRGAHNEKYIIPPNAELLDTLHRTSGNLVKILSISPETEGAIELIQKYSDQITMSIAHTTCNYELAEQAIAAGATSLTHTFNAMTPINHTMPGPIGAAFDHNLFVELICDGIHIHPTIIKMIFKLFGSDRVIMISDSMRACDLSDGEYDLGGQTVYVNGRRASLKSGVLAGSVTNLMDCVRQNVSIGIPLHDAIQASAVNPAKHIKIFDEYGSLDVGKYANIVVLNKDLSVHAIIQEGKFLSQ